MALGSGLALELVAICLATGALGGFLAGLLGVGGGIIVVPALFFCLGLVGVDPAVRMHVAVATSLATIVPTSITSARAHRARGSLDVALFRAWSPALFVGAVLGTAFASAVKGAVLTAVFGAVALLVALQMAAFPGGFALAGSLPRRGPADLLAAAIGAVAAVMGIGGGTLSVPVMSLFSVGMRMAVGTGAAFGLVISAPAVVGYAIGGWGVPARPPYSLGYVNLAAAAALLVPMLLSVPYGARVAHAIPQARLKRVFGVVLGLVGLRMLGSLL